MAARAAEAEAQRGLKPEELLEEEREAGGMGMMEGMEEEEEQYGAVMMMVGKVGWGWWMFP